MKRSNHRSHPGSGVLLLRQALFWGWITAAIAAVLIFSVPGDLEIAEGDVAAQDIRAPRDVTYISAILTEQAREDAVRRVQPLYTTPDPNVAREQYSRARDVAAYLRAIRADPYGSETQRIAWIWAVPELADLPQSSAQSILNLPDASWNRVQLEFLDMLDQVMRQEEIRETDLNVIRSRIPAMVSLDLAQDEAVIVQDLVTRFVRPNVFYDEEATQTAEQAARDAVGPAPISVRSGQVIVREGTVVTALDMEALRELGLTATADDGEHTGAAVLFAAVTTLGYGLFIGRLQPQVLEHPRQEMLIALVLTTFLGLGWLLMRSGELVPYLYPGTAAAMLLATTVGGAPALGAAAIISAVTGWVATRSLSISATILLGSLFAIITLPKYEQTGSLFRSGLLGGVVQALVVLAFSVDDLAITPIALMLKMGTSIVGGVIAGGLTVGGLFVLTPLFDLTTTFRLTELSRPNHPLLQRLLREAPATFNHVMTVASLAEQAAERIGANALLTRVGAYYHDVGKLARPYFFIENQQGLSNPHDRLDPYTSVDILSGHIRDGLKLAKQYRLPSRVRAFIPEHHGTMQVSFLYQKAVEAANGEADLVDETHFRYPGPKPQSKETLLVMLADSSEAATRATRPATPEDLAALIDKLFQQRMRDGQMDDCPITMQELDIVKRTYVELLRGAFHPRVQYPERRRAEPEPERIEIEPEAAPAAIAQGGKVSEDG